jgi:DNA-binding GntR family transcriptional regulator
MTLAELKKEIYKDSGISASKLIYDYFTEEIVQLRIAPGASINEVKFSAALDISRSPVRTALDQLEEVGLIKQERGKQAKVTTLSQTEYYMMSELRMAVEGQAACSLAYTITDEEIREMRALLEKVKQGEQADLPYPVNDANYHEYIIRTTQNKFLISAYELYRTKLIRYRNFSYKHLKMDIYGKRMRYGIHEAIFYAISRHDAESARRAAIDDALIMRMSTNLFE